MVVGQDLFMGNYKRKNLITLGEIKMENQEYQSMCTSMHRSESEREDIDIHSFLHSASIVCTVVVAEHVGIYNVDLLLSL